MELFAAIKYIKYISLSQYREGHGIHTPFVFDLVSRIFRNKTDPGIVNKIESIRRKMVSDKRTIVVTDLGSGSRRMDSKERRICDIVRNSAIPLKYGVLLCGMSKAFGYPLILEFGTSFGIGTMYLASANPDIPVYTMEGCSVTCAIAAENFKEAGLSNIRLMSGSFDNLLAVLENESISPGLVFIDGDHRREPLIRYFEAVTEMSGSDTVVIIDDIYSGKEMAQAWEMIRNHAKVTLTIDIYRMGMVFFRKGVAKANYTVLY